MSAVIFFLPPPNLAAAFAPLPSPPTERTLPLGRLIETSTSGIGLVLVEAVLRLPFSWPVSKTRKLLMFVAGEVFRTFPGLEATLFETFNYVTETDITEEITGYRLVYGIDYRDFETDSSRKVQDSVDVSSAGDVSHFDLRAHEPASLALALERQYPEASNVRVESVVNRVLVIRGLHVHDGFSTRSRSIRLPA